jgi:hypothetical protein
MRLAALALLRLENPSDRRTVGIRCEQITVHMSSSGGVLSADPDFPAFFADWPAVNKRAHLDQVPLVNQRCDLSPAPPVARDNATPAVRTHSQAQRGWQIKRSALSNVWAGFIGPILRLISFEISHVLAPNHR